MGEVIAHLAVSLDGFAPPRRRTQRNRVRRDARHGSGDHRPRTFDFAQGWAGDHHDGVPIFVLTHAVPDEPAPESARYVTDGIESRVAQAKAAAGGRDILLHGAAAAQECLRAGLLDAMELQLMPVLLGQGRRLFENMPPDLIELELLRALDGPGVQHLRYRVRSEA